MNPNHKIVYQKQTIPKVGTHNTIPPFNMEIDPGVREDIHFLTHLGEKDTPVCYIGAGTHGDEINGVLAVLKIHEKLKKEKLNGTVILVPVQNPVGYKFRTRLNPYDPIDPDWVHPGNLKGSYTQRVKAILNNISSKANCIIDLHTSGRRGSNNTMIYVPPEVGNGAGNLSLELSKVFGGDRIIFGKKEENYGWPVRNAMPFVAVREGRAGIYAEGGTGGSSIPEEKFVNYFITGVLNVLKKMGILEGGIVEQGERRVENPLDDKSVSVKAEVSGIFMPKITVGDKVKKGEILAEIYSIPEGVKVLSAPLEGLITYRHMLGPISKNERVATISP